jgi:electron transfer flavoprotein alpha subunit
LKGILILAEIDEEANKVSTESLELLNYGRRLSLETSTEISAVIIGHELHKQVEEIAEYAHKIYVVDHPLLKDFNPDLYVYALEKTCYQLNPAYIILSHTHKGAEVAPRLSARLKVPLTTDCIGLELDAKTGLLKRKKQVFGGNVIATYICDGFPQLVTVRPKTFEPVKDGLGKRGEVFWLNLEIDESISRIKLIERVQEEVVRLDDAEVIISGGRGLGGPEGFKELERLKTVLEKLFKKVEIGSTRPPVEKGWISPSRQIGLTGKKVSPIIYLAVGISGAVQHIIGIENSKIIISINKDPSAPIFSISNYGVVGDYKEILPALRRGLEELL